MSGGQQLEPIDVCPRCGYADALVTTTTGGGERGCCRCGWNERYVAIAYFSAMWFSAVESAACPTNCKHPRGSHRA